MDRWTPLTPTRAVSDSHEDEPVFLAEVEQASAGGLPPQLVLRVLDHVPIATLSKVEQTTKAMQSLVRDEQLWKWRWDRLQWQPVEGLDDSLLNTTAPPLHAITEKKNTATVKGKSTVIDLLADLDEKQESDRPYADRVRKAYETLHPFFTSLIEASSTTSSLLFTHPKVTTLAGQCTLMRNLAYMASNLLRGTPGNMEESVIKSKVWNAFGYLEMELRSAFQAQEAERAGGNTTAEQKMRHYAQLAWNLRDLGWLLNVETRAPSLPRAALMHRLGGSCVAYAHIVELPLFHQPVPHNPKKCIQFSHRSESAFSADPIRSFEDHLEKKVVEEVALIQRLFPHEQGVELVFFEKLASDMVRRQLT